MNDCPLSPALEKHLGGRWRLRATALMPILLLASHAAHSQLQSSASLTNVQYEVIDLRPDDGLAASYTLGSDVPENNLISSRAYAYVQRGRYEGPTVSKVASEPTFGAPVSAEVTWYAGVGRGSYSEAEGFRSFAYLSDGGRTYGLAGLAAAMAYNLDSPSPENWGGVMLAPYTSLTISADAAATLTNFAADSNGLQFLVGRAYLAWTPASGPYLDAYTDKFEFERWYEPVTGTIVDQRRLQITITNDSADFAFGSLYLGAYTSVGLVPEPSTYALMAAGLGAIVMLRRRVNRAARNDDPPPTA